MAMIHGKVQIHKLIILMSNGIQKSSPMASSPGDKPQKSGFEPNLSLLSSLINSLPLNIYAKDKKGTFLFSNRYYCNSVGKKLSDIIGKNDFDLHPDDLARKYRVDDQRIMQKLQVESIEEEWQTIGGQRGFNQVVKSPLYDDVSGDEVIGTIGIFWDITDRKKTEIELAEERNLLRTLIDNIPNYIYVKDRQSRFIVANESVAQAMGAKNPEELLGKTDADFFSKEASEKFLKDEFYVLEQGVSLIDMEEVFRSIDGTDTWSVTSKLPLKNIDGETVGIIGIGKDITTRKKEEIERRNLELQLLQAQKMETVGTLTAGIAHDFNNLLSVINGYSELLTVGMSKDDPQYKSLSKILQAGKSASELVSQLMAFSRKQVIQRQIVDLNVLLEKVQVMLHRLIGEKIDIQLHLDPELWPVEIDPTQMEQVIVNFATNARDAMPDGGVLKLETANILKEQPGRLQNQDLEPGEYILFSVTDNGCGINIELHERIFEPFFTTKQKAKGTGLGLATIFGIVKQNGGNVELHSEEGKGTSFKVYLPKAAGKYAEPVERFDEDLVLTGTENVLVVEDETDVRELITEVLSRQGYRVQNASNGIEALQLALTQQKNDFELLITDVVMPGMSGKELVEKILAHYPDIKIIFVSGYANDEISEYDLDRPGRAFIHKPFSPSVIAQKVREILDA